MSGFHAAASMPPVHWQEQPCVSSRFAPMNSARTDFLRRTVVNVGITHETAEFQNFSFQSMRQPCSCPEPASLLRPPRHGAIDFCLLPG
jgi:hypothetical protein